MKTKIELLVINGSPTVGSSTDILLDRMARAFTESLEGSVTVARKDVRLNDLVILPCQACGEAPTPAWCFFKDDLSPVYDELARCDCLMFGSPVYFDSVSAQAKLFIDRCNCFRPADFEDQDPEHDFLKLLPEKRPGAMALVGGERGWFEGARKVIAGFFKWVEVTNEGIVMHKSPSFHDAGSAETDDKALAEADAVGHNLAEQLLQRSA